MSWRRIWFTTTILIGLTLILGATELWQLSFREAARSAPSFYWMETAFLVLPSWFVFALLTPAILFLSERFPLERERLRYSIPIHVVTGFLFALAHLSLTSWITVSGLPRLKFWELMSRVFGTYLVYDVLNYWLIVGITHAVQYYRQYREREMQAVALERSLSEARLQALRSQLNPHFLYNTLNSISTMALKGDNHAVVQTLAKLSDLLRASLNEDEAQEVPLRKELELTDLFLDIQQIRFGERLHIEKTIDPSTADALVPSMILQPLVENAVKHGIAREPGEGRIDIRTERANGRVTLEVRDSGPGFQSAPDSDHGIGLSNTRNRLEQLYGAGYEVVCSNPAGGGAAVTITIPFRTRSQQ